jgi:hypothetical protein
MDHIHLLFNANASKVATSKANMIESINAYLQDKGFEPNKEMSTAKFTAYNIDRNGEETIMDNLIVNNVNQTWIDKINDVRGNKENLIIELGDAYSWGEAKNYIRKYNLIIDPWISTEEEIQGSNQKILAYKDRMIEHIYKLQAFAFFTKEYFMNNKYGRNYIENFDFGELIIDDGFRDYFLSLQKIEQDKEKTREDPKPITKQNLKEIRKLFRELKSGINELEKTADNLIMKQFIKEDRGYE